MSVSEAEVEAAIRAMRRVKIKGSVVRDTVMHDDALRAYARAALTAAASARWRPIEEQQGDEMFIYYWPRDGKRCVGLAYRGRDGGWRDSEGNWEKRITPTHFISLPSPPETER